MNRAQIELIEEEIIAEVTAIEELRVNMTKANIHKPVMMFK